MKQSEAIVLADARRPNTVKEETKAYWLWELDGQLVEFLYGRTVTDEERQELIKRTLTTSFAEGTLSFIISEGGDGNISYDDDGLPENVWPGDRELLIPAPFTETYILYLCAKIDYENQETSLYANDYTLYNSYMDEFKAWWRRTHKPAATGNWRVM